ncbi:hypothetical protein NXZ75_15390 [Lysinibacillus sphaericus]|uniref:hypothetical protein n=1 Tax=Lysinibacillus sphaericus TaxID=1421 RepID=UPI0021626C9F|nr:hypothetical protein [Lysinibacillus sphaericus]MCS1383593.1 hypothetical protein [Lysinibacillus sphaericus]
MLKPLDLPDDYQFNPVNFECFIDSTNIFWLNFLQSYRLTVNEKYQDIYSEYPNEFIYMQNLEGIALFKNHEITFHVYNNSIDAFNFACLQFHTFKEYKVYSELSDLDKKEHIKSLCQRSDSPLKTFNIKYGYQVPTLIPGDFDVTKNPNDLPEMGTKMGVNVAVEHGNKLIYEKRERFALFNLEQYVPMVKDEHFEYEIAEAIKAYRSELYLAATAVTGVAMENLLSIIIIKKCGEDKLPKRRYIKD